MNTRSADPILVGSRSRVSRRSLAAVQPSSEREEVAPARHAVGAEVDASFSLDGAVWIDVASSSRPALRRIREPRWSWPATRSVRTPPRNLEQALLVRTPVDDPLEDAAFDWSRRPLPPDGSLRLPVSEDAALATIFLRARHLRAEPVEVDVARGLREARLVAEPAARLVGRLRVPQDFDLGPDGGGAFEVSLGPANFTVGLETGWRFCGVDRELRFEIDALVTHKGRRIISALLAASHVHVDQLDKDAAGTLSSSTNKTLEVSSTGP